MNRTAADTSRAAPAGRTAPNDPVEFRLAVWLSVGHGWRARVTGADGDGDAAAREFATPFDLARFVGWPMAVPAAPARD